MKWTTMLMCFLLPVAIVICYLAFAGTSMPSFNMTVPSSINIFQDQPLQPAPKINYTPINKTIVKPIVKTMADRIFEANKNIMCSYIRENNLTEYKQDNYKCKIINKVCTCFTW